MRAIKGKFGVLITIWCVGTSIFHLYGVFEVYNIALLSAMHLLLLLSLGFLLFPATSNSPKDKPTSFDFFLAVASATVALYLAARYQYITERWYMAHPVSTLEFVLGTINILLIIEATRRMVNSVMAILVGLFILHVLLGQYLPGILNHPGFPLKRVVEMFYLNRDQGIYGMLTSISATYLILFVTFGAFIAQTGIGDYFIDLAYRISGESPGGPAKVSIWSSALFGTVSGIGVANIYTTGSFTIPMMKRYGYTPEFAGAVEAAASTGGQYMPPIMGAAAFIMAQLIGVPYVNVALYASISAFLYYVSMSFCIHMRARKLGLKSGGMEGRKSVTWLNLLKRSYNLAPLVVIVSLLVNGYSPLYAGIISIFVTITISFFEKEKRMTVRKIIQSLEEGVKNTIMVASACGGAGIIVASISHTAFGVSFVSVIMQLSHGSLFVAIVLTAVLSFILGVGMPTTPAYILAASLTAPILEKMGIDVVAAHLFVLYFAKISELTPPVAICAYAAAALAKADSFKTGIEAVRLSVSGFVLPVAFVYNTALVFKGSPGIIALSVGLATVGLWLINGGLEGWMFGRIRWPAKLGFFVLGISCFLTHFGVAIGATMAGLLITVILARKERIAMAEAAVVNTAT